MEGYGRIWKAWEGAKPGTIKSDVLWKVILGFFELRVRGYVIFMVLKGILGGEIQKKLQRNR